MTLASTAAAGAPRPIFHHRPPATTVVRSPTAAQLATVIRRTAAFLPARPASARASELASLASSAAVNSAPEAKRSAGSFDNAVNTTDSNEGDTAGRISRMDRGADVRARDRTAWAVGPVNGGSPTSISYRTAPRA